MQGMWKGEVWLLEIQFQTCYHSTHLPALPRLCNRNVLTTLEALVKPP